MKKSTIRSYLLTLLLVSVGSTAWAKTSEIYVSPDGRDANPGTREKPLATLIAARNLARSAKQPGVGQSILLLSGTYYLTEPLKLEAADSGTADAPVVYAATPGNDVTISGGRLLPQQLRWKPYKKGIYQARLTVGNDVAWEIDQLFINGQRMHMARYPNYNPSIRNYGGTAADAISPARIKTWANPIGGLVHGLHAAEWGDFQYRIVGIDAQGNARLEGGWQNNRQMGMHKTQRFVENIFEELDAPGEWFYNRASGELYVYPPAGVDLAKARVESAGLKCLIDVRGSRDAPVCFVAFRNMTFTHTARTFLEPYEPLLRSDWRIYRGGAVFLQGAENCTIESCFLKDVGGNGIFVSNYNRRHRITHCKVIGAGASAICFVGDLQAARTDAMSSGARVGPEKLDTTPGPKSDNYPADCRVDDCLLHSFGVYEKQTAGVEIDLAESIVVSHASIYDCPRAGINIGDGCWGGHLIEFCDVFDTVKETGDHGSFNSWGRDRYWGLNKAMLDKYPDMPFWDCRKPNTLCNSRWRCDHGWDIDLDDGSSNYVIFNNVCLNGGLKFREGYRRTGENNILVNSTFHPHVWYPNSGDVFRHNIVMRPYAPIGMPSIWGKQCDENLLVDPASLENSRKQGRDLKSDSGDPKFLDAAHGDFRVADDSPALKVGFKNFAMDQFGVVSADLRAEAETPSFGRATSHEQINEQLHSWRGAQVKSVTTLGEVSVAGLSAVAGVILQEVPENSAAGQAGLKRTDVIVTVNGAPVETFRDFNRLLKNRAQGKVHLGVMREQKLETVDIEQ